MKSQMRHISILRGASPNRATLCQKSAPRDMQRLAIDLQWGSGAADQPKKGGAA